MTVLNQKQYIFNDYKTYKLYNIIIYRKNTDYHWKGRIL